ncbi:MAG: HPr family phosphocarrier protein [Chthoniobacteraceae bacterium]
MGILSRNTGAKIAREAEIMNKLGMHARPCAKFVKLANTFRAEVWVCKDSDTVNGKSIMGLMMLAAGTGSRLMITCEGTDAEKAIEALEKLILSKFDED